MTATLAVRINISLLRIAFSPMNFVLLVFQLLGIAVGSVDSDAFVIVTPVARVNKPGPCNFALNFSV
jgi:hypothetical protein